MPMKSFYELTKDKEVSELFLLQIFIYREAHILGRQNLLHYSTANSDSRARKSSSPPTRQSSAIKKPLSPVKRKQLSCETVKKPSSVVYSYSHPVRSRFVTSSSVNHPKSLSQPAQVKGLNVYQRLSLPVTKGTYAVRNSIEPAPRLSSFGSQRSTRPTPVDEKQHMVQQMEDLRRKNVRLTAELEKCKVRKDVGG